MPRRVVKTEMTGSLPALRGPRGPGVIEQSGCLPIRILDASSVGVTAPTDTQDMRENRVPKVHMGLSRKGS